MKRKIILLALALGLSSLGFLAYRAYQAIYRPNLEADLVLWVYPNTSFEAILDSCRPYLKDPADFERIAQYKELEDNFKVGRYEFEAGMSANRMVNLLRSGSQSPLALTINLVKDLEDLSQLLGERLLADSSAFSQYFNSTEFKEQYQLQNSEALGFFIPDTYEVYWTESPESFARRMQREREKFWQKRKEDLADCPLSRREVETLASIVESETARFDEMPVVAGLYLNRLEQNIKLESDPTVIYAWQQLHPQDEIKRVLYKHLRVESPYNTYQNLGLPPGPIRISSPQAIDAVLQAQDHDYIFMCADPKRPGYHAFADNLREHNRNRQNYIRWLEKQKRLARSGA